MLYDLIIIGSGPAGLTASIYASRYQLNHLVIGKLLGGTITWAHKVENFPGFKEISGFELGQKMVEQVKSFGKEIIGENVGKIEKIDEGFKVITDGGKEFSAKTVIVATGTERRKLNVPGENEYLGKGVSYCTTCDAAFFKNKTVVLVGGSNAACSGASHLAQFTQKVYLIYRRDELRAEPVWVNEVKNNPKVEIIYNTNITKILGNLNETEGQGRVVAVELDNPYNGEKILKTDGVFVEIGGIPVDSFLKPVAIELDEDNYIKVNERMGTSLAGLFAAGDVTTHSLIMSQVIVACADGAIAAGSAYQYLKGMKAPKIVGKQGI